MRRTFAIGDIHGCRDLLAALFALINPDPQQDAVIILGDFINRGPDSRGTIELLLELRGKFRDFIVLRGNHEQMFLDYLAGRDQVSFLTAGGKEMLASYGIGPLAGDKAGDTHTDWLPAAHYSLLTDLPGCYENEHGIYVHAGLQPGVHLARQTPEWLLWSREEFINSACDFGKPVVFGHTPFDHPLIAEDKIGIDTGAVYGGSLSCLILPEAKVISVPGQRWWGPANKSILRKQAKNDTKEKCQRGAAQVPSSLERGQ